MICMGPLPAVICMGGWQSFSSSNASAAPSPYNHTNHCSSLQRSHTNHCHPPTQSTAQPAARPSHTHHCSHAHTNRCARSRPRPHTNHCRAPIQTTATPAPIQTTATPQTNHCAPSECASTPPSPTSGRPENWSPRIQKKNSSAGWPLEGCPLAERSGSEMYGRVAVNCMGGCPLICMGGCPVICMGGCPVICMGGGQ